MFECTEVVEKPWGRELILINNGEYVVKQIEVTAGHALSLQYHEKKRETMFLLSGEMEMTLGDKTWVVKKGEYVDIETKAVHRVKAVTDIVILEVSTCYLDDVVRLKDDYGREGTSEA